MHRRCCPHVTYSSSFPGLKAGARQFSARKIPGKSSSCKRLLILDCPGIAVSNSGNDEIRTAPHRLLPLNCNIPLLNYLLLSKPLAEL